jgi:hypothetical protein
MLPLGAELFTSMNPFAAKIWIGGRAVRHASTCGERTTIVPSRVLPDPAKRCGARSLGADPAAWVDPEPEVVVVGVLEPWVALAPVLAPCAGLVRVREAAPLFARELPLPPLPAATIAGPL